MQPITQRTHAIAQMLITAAQVQLDKDLAKQNRAAPYDVLRSIQRESITRGLVSSISTGAQLPGGQIRPFSVACIYTAACMLFVSADL